MRKWMFVGFACLLTLSATAAQAQQTIQGYPVTGVNRLLSEPVFDLGPSTAPDSVTSAPTTPAAARPCR